MPSDFGLFLLLLAALFGAVLLIRFFAWLTDVRDAGGPIAYARQASERYVVKRSDTAAPVVMSREEDNEWRSGLSDLRPDTDQTQTTTYNRAGMIDIYRLMRKYNIPREEARAAFQSAALPLDNNQWAKVAPPAPHVTPIAGRATNAVFEEGELAFVPPPR